MVQLNPGQQQAYTAIVSGTNTFVTGPGGTGKSYLITCLLETLPSTMKVSITAMTGCAALLLVGAGGSGVKGRGHAKTLHSWAGIGLGKEPVGDLVKRIKKSGRALKNWLTTDLLIVDEVSMLTADLLEKLDMIGQHLRSSGRPFGGLQVVFMGDFFQLPPVVRGVGEDVGKHFAFASPRWKTIMERTVHLTEIVRQRDPVFQNLLNAVRKGALGPEHLAILEARKGLAWKDKEIRPTLLFSRRAEVDTINDANLKALDGRRVSWKARTVIDADAPSKALNLEDGDIVRAIETMDREAAYEPELTLAVGAQVMLVTNLDMEAGLVNGSRGVVVNFTGPDVAIMDAGWEIEGMKGVKRMQVPLRLAYAVTIHRAQGATLDCALIDIGTRTFEYGQAYVALSRVRSLESLYVWDVNPKAVKAHPRVAEFYASLGEA
jgi:ATP-dependent DNA helicase PIF1